MISIKKYVRPQSLEEAYELNQKKQNRVIGGMHFLKMGKGTVDTAIDLCDLGLSGIKETDEMFEIGAMTSLRELETHEGLLRYTEGAVKEALKDIVGVQFRNTATIGGSLYGRYGFSDILTLFMCMDSYAELYKGGTVPLCEFSEMAHDRDIIVRLIIKKTPGHFSYRALRLSKTDIPVLNSAASFIDGKYRVTVGARPMRAVTVSDTRGFLTGGLTEEAIEGFSLRASETVPTGSNMRGSKEYRSRLVKVLVSQNLKELGGKGL